MNFRSEIQILGECQNTREIILLKKRQIPTYKWSSWPRDINNCPKKSKFIDNCWPDMTFDPEWPDVHGQNGLQNPEIHWSALLTFWWVLSFSRTSIPLTAAMSEFLSGWSKPIISKPADELLIHSFSNLVDDWSKLKIFESDQSNDFKSFTKNDSSSENDSSRVNFNSERILKQRKWKFVNK